MPSHIKIEPAVQAKYCGCATAAFEDLKSFATVGASFGLVMSVLKVYKNPKIVL
jgi:hypothetical protein